MILPDSDLPTHAGKVAMVDGGFDPLHHGHLEYFEEAAKLGHPLLCAVSPDEYVRLKHAPLVPEADRCRLIDALRPISFTHLRTRSTAGVLEHLRPAAYVKGRDWEGRLPAEEIAVCTRLAIPIVYLDTVRGSSSVLFESYLGTHPIRRFEQLSITQRLTPAEHYDDDYFTGEWREGGENYTLENRRKIEGRNPNLIKEVFEPRHALDLGCGPGALMTLLDELGVKCDGIDFSPQIKALAPERVRSRITVADVTAPVLPDNAFDLVICRELLEHLTIAQVQRTVQNVCRMTSRYAYITTRYHPAPVTLLDVTDEKHVDPSHITLLTKDLMDLLFVLQGMKRRPDLEKRMDWLNKGRVLVYEKPA